MKACFRIICGCAKNPDIAKKMRKQTRFRWCTLEDGSQCKETEQQYVPVGGCCLPDDEL